MNAQAPDTMPPIHQSPELTCSPRYSPALPGWNPGPAPSSKPTIGVLPGEGVGPEVIAASLDVLQRVTELTGQSFEICQGGKIGLLAKAECGQVLPQNVVDFCNDVFTEGGAIFAGPGGGRFVYELRDAFDLFCKFTPLRPLVELHDCGVIRPEKRDRIDIVMVRENSGGLYFGESYQVADALGRTTVSHRYGYRDDQVERILRVAAALARMRRQRLCLVVKPGGIPSISTLWNDTLKKVASGTSLEIQVLEVDNAAYQLIDAARNFDVVVSPNMFGDVLADCGSLLLGSRGLSYSGNFSANGAAVYQTGHGAAHDLAGRNIANPIGQIFSLTMMLRESFGLFAIADAVESAVAMTLAAGWRTADIAGPTSRIIGTREMGEKVSGALEPILSSRALA